MYYNIAISSDSNYVKPLMTLIYSIALNNEVDKFIFYILTDNKEKMKKYFRKKIEFKDMNIIFCEIDISEFRFNVNKYFNKVTYYKLFLDIYIPKNVDRVLYLDSDIIVNDNIEGIFNYSSIKSILAVKEPASGNYLKRLKIPYKASYFNAGVLLINLKKIRKESSFKKIRNCLNDIKLKWLDQDILNKYFYNDWTELQNLWNYHRYYMIDELLYENRHYNSPNKKIIHYNGVIKPWNNNEYIKYREIYNSYYSKLFKNEIIYINNRNLKFFLMKKSLLFRILYRNLRNIKHKLF